MRARQRERAALLAAAVMLAGAGLTVAQPAAAAASPTTAEPALSLAAAIPRPADDPFYDVPAHVHNMSDGTVLRSRRLPASALAEPVHARVWQLLYKTRDNAGRATATVGTLLVPTAPWTGRGSRPLLSYQVPEDALTTSCAPSYVLLSGAEVDDHVISQVRFDRGQVMAAVRRGWAVMVPDYEGPDSQFYGAAAAAHGVLDGVRAALSLAPASVHRNAPVGLWGYSGGGFATAAAAQKQSRYAPELTISAVAEGGVPADLNAALRAMSGQAFSGWIPFGFAALENAYPHAHVDRYLNRAARGYADAVAHACAGVAVADGPHNAKLEEFEAWPGSLTQGRFHRFAHDVSLIGFGGTPSVPVYMYHGTTDELLPVTAARELAARYRDHGVSIEWVEHAGQTHGSEQSNGVAGAVAFLKQRFSEHHHSPGHDHGLSR
jgi:hypothetical protein